MRWVAAALFLFVLSASGAVLDLDGTEANWDTQYAAASNGDTLRFPTGGGTYTWANTKTITKALKIQGAGAGQIIANSQSSVSIGTGSKTWTVWVLSRDTFTAGNNIIAYRVLNPADSMTGTVTSYNSGTGELVCNITSTTGSGTEDEWYFVKVPSAVTILRSSTSGTSSSSYHTFFNVTSTTGAHTEFTGIQFESHTGQYHIFLRLNGATGSGVDTGRTYLLNNLYFKPRGGSGGIISRTNKVLLYDFSADTGGSFASSDFQTCGFIQLDSTDETSWTTNGSIGTADTDGLKNFYMEDGYVTGFNTFTDWLNNSRWVARHCTFYSAGMGSHGTDSATYGNRHGEVYDCLLLFLGRSDGLTAPLNWWVDLRGGTLVFTSNIVIKIFSNDYSTKTDIHLQLQQLRRNSGAYACYGSNEAGGSYPAPHQVGWGYENGAAIIDPIYVWGNTEYGGPLNVNPVDYSNSESDSCALAGHTGLESVSTFVVSGRDYYYDGTARPSYTKYEYPHPLRSEEEPEPTPTPKRQSFFAL